MKVPFKKNYKLSLFLLQSAEAATHLNDYSLEYRDYV